MFDIKDYESLFNANPRSLIEMTKMTPKESLSLENIRRKKLGQTPLTKEDFKSLLITGAELNGDSKWFQSANQVYH